MSEFSIFAFEEKVVRVHQGENGNPWFVAKDVALALGYQWNGSACIAHVPEEWKGVRSDLTPSGVQKMLTLSEQGLYFFLGRSDKPKALPFQKWLAGEVLPSIRKTGSYVLPGVAAARECGVLEDLPQDILGIHPRQRAHCYHLALQTMRVTGEMGLPVLRKTFIELCRGLSSVLPMQGKSASHTLPVGEFVRQCCEYGPYLCKTADLFAAYNDWCRETGLAQANAIKVKGFAQAFAALPGIGIKRRRPFLIFEGVRLVPDWKENLREEVRRLEGRHA